ncbi:MAG: glycosyltransferase family 61 protein [Coleofasciculus sp. Co-bin14]|nr:glycosyltransferase family 61 protein [Coleofasciculus sp. Co-bin14]
MKRKQLSRLLHRIKITSGQLSYPFFDALYKFRMGSASRLRQVLLSPQAPPDCKSSLLLYPTPLPVREPEYFAPGPIEKEYLKKFRVPRQGGERISCPAGIISARDVSVSLPIGMHWWNGRVFDDALLDPVLLTNPKYIIDLEKIPFKKKKRITEPVVFLSMPWHHNLYHWLIEILPRLSLYEQSEDINNLRLVMPSSVPGFIRDSLALAGYLDKVLFLEDGVYHFEQLHLLSRLSPSSMPSPVAIKWLNENLARPKSSKKRRTYVSRADAKYRFVTNELEVQDLLSEFGFEKVVLSDYTLEEKILIFQESEMVIGSSGAGFSGIAFMEPGSLFLEFFSNGHYADCFYNMANLKNLKYGFLVGKKDGLGFSIDTTQLRMVVEKVIADGF